MIRLCSSVSCRRTEDVRETVTAAPCTGSHTRNLASKESAPASNSGWTVDGGNWAVRRAYAFLTLFLLAVSGGSGIAAASSVRPTITVAGQTASVQYLAGKNARWVITPQGMAPVAFPLSRIGFAPAETVTTPRGQLALGVLPPPVTGISIGDHAVRYTSTSNGTPWVAAITQSQFADSEETFFVGRTVLPAVPSLSLGTTKLSKQLGLDALSLANLQADAASERYSQGSDVVSFSVEPSSLRTALGLGIHVPSGVRCPCYIGLVTGHFPVGSRVAHYLFLVGPGGIPFSIHVSGGLTTVSPVETTRSSLTGAAITVLRAPIFFDLAAPRVANSAVLAVRGYMHSLGLGDPSGLQRYVTPSLYVAAAYNVMNQLSNPHTSGYQVLGVRSLGMGYEAVQARVFTDYTGFGNGGGILGIGEQVFITKRTASGTRLSAILP